jgi:hypothetical protein
METPLNFIFKESTPFQINNGDVLGNPSLGQRVVLEVLFKHIESKLIMESKPIPEYDLPSPGSRSDPRGVLEFTGLSLEEPAGRGVGVAFNSVRPLVNYLAGENERLRYLNEEPVAKRLRVYRLAEVKLTLPLDTSPGYNEAYNRQTGCSK